jgi:hypothetical protein
LTKPLNRFILTLLSLPDQATIAAKNSHHYYGGFMLVKKNLWLFTLLVILSLMLGACGTPVAAPTAQPTIAPIDQPTTAPVDQPTAAPAADQPTTAPSDQPTALPANPPTVAPSTPGGMIADLGFRPDVNGFNFGGFKS